MTDAESAVGPTPWTACFTDQKMTVRAYGRRSADDDWGLGATVDLSPPCPTPVLLVPPLMVKPFIFDLTEQRSMVRHLQRAGFDVYLLDFGEPDDRDREVTLSDYVLRWMPAAVEAAKAHSGASEVFIAGYCMGGLFALMHCAASKAEDVKGVVTIGSPFDSHKMGVLSVLARLFDREVGFVSDRLGNVPGALSSSMFKLMHPLKQVTRYADLFMNLYDEQYVQSFDALSAWTNGFIDYPQRAFQQVFQQFMVGNEFKGDGLALESVEGGAVVRVKLSDVRQPVLAFAGESDDVVRPAAVKELPSLVSSEDVEVMVAPGGHMGVFAGRGAPEAVWTPAAAWMRARG